MSEPRERLTQRERVAAWCILWLVQILAPWEYKHQHTEVIDAIKKELSA